MKKILLRLLGVVLLLGAAGFIFKQQLWEIVVMVASKDTFIAADTDNYDPGLAIGDTFPNIKAMYRGEEVYDVRPFAQNKGMILSLIVRLTGDPSA